MIVVSIIGVMALIAIPTWTAALNKSEMEVCRRNQSLIFEQMNIYCLEHNEQCAVNTFNNILSVRQALCSDEEAPSERYIKRPNAFTCPSNAEGGYGDYRFVRNGSQIIDIECDITEEHN